MFSLGHVCGVLAVCVFACGVVWAAGVALNAWLFARAGQRLERDEQRRRDEANRRQDFGAVDQCWDCGASGPCTVTSEVCHNWSNNHHWRCADCEGRRMAREQAAAEESLRRLAAENAARAELGYQRHAAPMGRCGRCGELYCICSTS